jgi:hypothetical protein
MKQRNFWSDNCFGSVLGALVLERKKGRSSAAEKGYLISVGQPWAKRDQAFATVFTPS